jgi:hypothetical protein
MKMDVSAGYGQDHLQILEEEDADERATTGEVVAIALVSFLTVTIFTVSIWSALSLATGNTNDGGPIGLIVNLMRSTGIV